VPTSSLFRPGSLALVALIGTWFGIGPIATDMFLPALAALPGIFSVDVPTAQQTMSVYLAGFALGQLIYGPVADRLGRRPAIIGGALLFSAASFACALAPSIETLIGGRFVQAIGTAFGLVLGRAVIRDLHQPAQMPRMVALASIIMASTTLISPSIGAQLLGGFGWWSIFVFHGVYALAIAVVVLLWFPESVPKLDPTAIRPLQTLRNFGGLLTDPVFASYAVSVSLVYGVLFTFLTSAPFVFIRQLGLSPAEFGLVFIPIALTNMVSSAVAARVTRRGPSARLYGTVLALLAAGMGLAVVATTVGLFGVVTMIVIMIAFSATMGFIVPLGFAGALAPHPMIAGTASTLIGLLQAVVGALAAQMVGVFYDDSPRPVVWQFLTLATLALALFLVLRRREPARG